MKPRSRLLFPALAALLAMMPAHGARADVIDGDWCLDGRSLSIDGSHIVTPGGTSMTGNYDRHGFSYVVPQKEPGAGSQVRMRLINDDVMQLSRGDKPGMPEIWHRCSRPIS